MAEDTTRSDASAVRAAATDVTAALDAHLSAIERMAGEQDPAVQAAYDALRATLARYDDLLFDTYGEVAPYRLPDPVDLEDEFEAVHLHEGPPRFGVVARWEFHVEDGVRLVERAREVWDREIAGEPDGVEGSAAAEGAALGELVDAVGAETVAASAHEYGLGFVGSTMWVVESAETGEAADDEGEIEDWRDFAFDDVDPEFVVFRADVHAGNDSAG